MIKKEGFVEYAFAILMMILMTALLMFTIRQRELKLVDDILQDSLTSAVLAAAIVDLDQYGTNGDIVIDRYHGRQSTGDEPINGLHVAYNNFLDALRVNLGNDIAGDKPTGVNGTQIVQNIRVQEFSVYNVLKTEEVYKLSVEEALLATNKKISTVAGSNELPGSMGNIKVVPEPITPDGEKIIGTTVYVNVVYELYDFNGKRLTDGIDNEGGNPLTGSRNFKVSIYEGTE